MVSELKDQNGSLKKEKDDLNRLIQEQSQQMTGMKASLPKISHLVMRKPKQRGAFLYLFRENGPCDTRGDSAAEDRSERGAISLPESPDGAPSSGGEVRRLEGGDGFLGEEH